MELKIQTRIWHCGSMGLLIKRQWTLPFMWLHLLREQHISTCPFDWVQHDGMRDTQISDWREVLCEELRDIPHFLKWEQPSTYTIRDDWGIPHCLESRHTALQLYNSWLSFFICQMGFGGAHRLFYKDEIKSYLEKTSGDLDSGIKKK